VIYNGRSAVVKALSLFCFNLLTFHFCIVLMRRFDNSRTRECRPKVLTDDVHNEEDNDERVCPFPVA
jgi:hypothetical protein